MKKAKQIFALLGVVLLAVIVILLPFAAGSATEENATVFNAAMVTVIVVPVLLWIYLYIFKLMNKKEDEKTEDKKDDKTSKDQK